MFRRLESLLSTFFYSIWFIPLFVLMVWMLSLSSCKRKEKIFSLSQKRARTLWDDASLAEITDIPPLTWKRVISGPQFRLLDYRFIGAEGEVYLSITGGSPIQNINRWRRQYHAPELANLDGLETVQSFGRRGFLIQLEKKKEHEQGREEAMLGFVCPYQGGVLTVKMLASPSEIQKQKKTFLLYCQKLRAGPNS